MLETFVYVSLAAVNAVVIGMGGWLVLHAERRHAWRARLQSARRGIAAFVGERIARSSQQAAATHKIAGSSLKRTSAYLLLRRRTMLAIGAILTIPAMLAVGLASSGQLEGYDDGPARSDPVIAALLQGEQLVAPPPLPPELFITRDVESVRQELAGASREWQALDTEFRRRLLAVYQLMARHGYRMALLEGYRSPERQYFLARLGSHVTNAGAYQSFHQYGLAADSAFYRDGKIIISEKDPWAMEGYRLYGQYAESVGLVWGGRWRMMDFGHVELRKTGILPPNQRF